MRSSNLLIEASAGTGKTQALAERLIELLRGDIKPHEIVALTFSRAAAGEIFERFVTLLAERAEKNPADVKLLREVIATQHLSQIGTLDSFLMRIVRSFPLELGLCGKVEIMDDYAAASARAEVAFGILRRTDAAVKRAFEAAFALAMNRENVRSFTESYRTFVKDWHERYLAMPDARCWGDEARIDLGEVGGRRSEVGQWNHASKSLEEAAAALEGIVDSPAWTEFVDWVRNFRGSFAGLKGFAKKFFEQGDAIFAGATVEVSYRKKFVFGGREAAAIRAAISAVIWQVVRMKVEMARGVFTLVSSFEEAYAKKVRRQGRLVFGDIPRLLLGLDETVRLGLEYRMDAKIRAWALDEFQDTSREQWKALSGLLDEAKQSDGEKSVFVVGDRKQAIYGWRNGDVGIFTGERESGAYETKELKKSWRYGTAIARAVNAVFVNGRLRDEFPDWESPEHETAHPEQTGFVQAVESPGGTKEDFIEPVFNALRAVDPIRRGISAAILVRTNGFGELLAAELKRRGLHGVVWEGESAILDTPALLAFLDPLYLADHPGDRQAYEHFRRSPLAAAKYGAEVPTAAEISGEFARHFSVKGLVRTFRELRACLPEDPSAAWSEFAEARFTDLLRAAAEFERTMEPGVRLADFVTYLAAQEKRNVAEPGKIRILTIHRSKGLGFDYVVLPLYEHEGLDAEPDGPLVADDWILPNPGVHVTRFVATFRAAAERLKSRSEQEALCTYYVAMTRAKQAMTIVLHPDPATSKVRRFSQFVREAIPEPLGNPAWYESMGKRSPDRLNEDESTFKQATGTSLPRERAPRQRILRRLPSLSFHTGESAGSLFRAASARKTAIERGLAAHAAFEQVEWIDSQDAKSDLERALVKPADFVTLWRERPFEIFAGGEWTSGRFDRVVFAGGKAVIYDFKTNARLRGESEADFAARMQASYAGQMAAYRKALVALTGLPAEKVSTVLLLTQTGAAVRSDDTHYGIMSAGE